MRGRELLRDFSRGNYARWIDNIIYRATPEFCTNNIMDIVECLDTKADVLICLDTSKIPVASPIKDATGNTIGYTPSNPLDVMEWERHQKKFLERKQNYEHNKQTICNIITASIDPYFLDKLQRLPAFDSYQYDLIWILKRIEFLCHHDGKQDHEPISEAIPMQRAVQNRPATLCQTTTSNIAVPVNSTYASDHNYVNFLPSDVPLHTNNQGALYIAHGDIPLTDSTDDHDNHQGAPYEVFSDDATIIGEYPDDSYDRDYEPSGDEDDSDIEYDGDNEEQVQGANDEIQGADTEDQGAHENRTVDDENQGAQEEAVAEDQGARDTGKIQGAEKPVTASTNGKNQGADEVHVNDGDQGFTTGNADILVETADEADDELKSQNMPNRLPHNIWMQNFMPAQGYLFKRNIFFLDTKSAMILERDKQSTRGSKSGYIDTGYFFLEDRTKPGNIDLHYSHTPPILL